jgi:hypothetical protein
MSAACQSIEERPGYALARRTAFIVWMKAVTEATPFIERAIATSTYAPGCAGTTRPPWDQLCDEMSAASSRG